MEYKYILELEGPTTLWATQVAHLNSPIEGYRVVLMYNYYTCHTLAVAAKYMTDGNLRVTGTVGLNLIDR